jgi:dTDP-4-amino-4,6-dideoxygalactose transaminase
VPLNRPNRLGRGAEYVAEVVASGQLGGGGRYTALCAERLRERLGAPLVLLTPSCATALELSVLLADLSPGDEVIVPSFTHPAAALAVAKTGAVPVFADITSDTLGLDPGAVEAAVTPRTRAIVPTHYAGVACDMAALSELAERHGLAVIEDAAHGLLADLDGRPLGSLGDAGCFSFDRMKNVSCGEGGALSVNRDDWVARAEVMVDRGTNRRAFARREVPAYSWVDLGATSVAGELVAAYLWGQLEVVDQIASARRAIWSAYHERLAAAEAAGTLRRPVVPEGRNPDGHIYYVLLPDREERDRAIARLDQAEVTAAFHFVPLHSSAAGLRYGRAAAALDVTDDVAARLVRLPIWPGLSEAEVERVVRVLVDAPQRQAGAARA